jgi:hypothetical protein
LLRDSTVTLSWAVKDKLAAMREDASKIAAGT